MNLKGTGISCKKQKKAIEKLAKLRWNAMALLHGHWCRFGVMKPAFIGSLVAMGSRDCSMVTKDDYYERQENAAL